MEYDDFDMPVEDQVIQEEEPIIESSQEEVEEIDLIGSLLKDRGIEDASKISFEGDGGEIIEKDWNDLTSEEQLNILRTTEISPETGLDDSEIQFINSIRSSQLTPQEYIQYIQNQAIESFKAQIGQPSYTIDQYNDDELYIQDLKTRISDISDEEAAELLERAKLNETLFNKQITALRNEYKQAEQQQLEQTKYQEDLQAKENYNRFAKSIEEEVIKFDSIANGNLNMSTDDKRDLYEFITGFDQAGNSWFGKALNDPETVVKMAWFALNGEQAFQDIQDFYNSEILKLKKENKPNSTYKPKQSRTTQTNNGFDDLDDF